MSRLGNPRHPQSVIICITLSFAIVLDAVPRPYTERFDHHYDSSLLPHHDRYHRQSHPNNAEKHFQHIDLQNEEGDPYGRSGYNYQRYPRDDKASAYNFLSMRPKVVGNRRIGPAIDEDFYPPPRLYVVPSTAADRDDNLTFGPKLRDLDTFPTSLMGQESFEANQRQALSDRELGKIVRQALESANYGDVERAFIPVRRFGSLVRKPARGLDLGYITQTRNINPHRSIQPETIIPEETAPEHVDADGLLDDSLDEFENSRPDTDLVATIGNLAEGREDQIATVPDEAVIMSEAEPVIHKVEGNEGTGDDAVEEDVVLSIIEDRDNGDENENKKEVNADGEKHHVQEDDDSDDILSAAVQPANTVKKDSKITDIEEDFSLADDLDEPLPPMEDSYTEESITDVTTKSGE